MYLILAHALQCCASNGFNPPQLPSEPHVPAIQWQRARPSWVSSHVCPRPWIAMRTLRLRFFGVSYEWSKHQPGLACPAKSGQILLTMPKKRNKLAKSQSPKIPKFKNLKWRRLGLHVLPKSKIQARGTCWLRARARSGKMQTPPGFKIACAFQTFHFTYFYIFLHYSFFSKTKNKDAGVQNITNIVKKWGSRPILGAKNWGVPSLLGCFGSRF